MGEEVKIVLRTEAQGTGAQKTKEQLDAVTNAGKKAAEATKKSTTLAPARGPAAPSPNRVARGSQATTDRLQQNQAAMEAHYAKIDAEKQASAAAEKKAKPANRQRAAIADAEQNLANARASGAAPDVVRQRETELRERKLTARFMREQGIPEDEATSKAQNLVSTQNAAKQRAADEKASVRDNAAARKAAVSGEREMAKEMRGQVGLRQQLTRDTVMLGRAVAGGGSSAALAGMLGVGGVVGAGVMGAGMLVHEVTKDYMERQGIANRDQASRASDQRNLQISAGWRGTSGQVQSQQFSTEQELFDRGNQRDEIRRRNQRAWYNPLRWLNGETSWEGRREEDENEKNITRLFKLQAAEKKLGHKKFEEEEGGLELDAVRQRSKRTMGGIRAAQVDDMARNGLAEFRRLRAMGASYSEAKEEATLKTENELRDKQIRSASGLVDARAGAGDIAAAARWSMEALPGNREVHAKLETLITTVQKSGHQSVEAQTREDFGK